MSAIQWLVGRSGSHDIARVRIETVTVTPRSVIKSLIAAVRPFSGVTPRFILPRYARAKATLSVIDGPCAHYGPFVVAGSVLRQT
jgi:hypothetical protein